MMKISTEIKKKKNLKRGEKAASTECSTKKSGTSVAPEVVVSAMQHIYSLARR